MTDNEIIKALECCSKEPMLNCRNCPYEVSCNMGRSDMQKDTLALINRQKAEIDALIEGQETLQKYIATVKAEAIKEFAGKLKAIQGLYGEVWVSDVDRVRKEMEESK